MKKILKIVFLMVCLVVVGLVGLFLYDNFMPSRAKKEEVEFCKCLKEYKTTLKCGKYGYSSSESNKAYFREGFDLFEMSNNSVARKKYQEMRVQWDLCQKRVKDCRMCGVEFLGF